MLGFVGFFLIIRLVDWGYVFGGENHRGEVKCHFSHIMLRLHTWLMTVDVAIHLDEVMLSGFSTVKFFSSPSPFHTVLIGRKSLHSSHLRIEELSSPPLEWSIYINYLDFLCMETLSLLPCLLIYSTIDLYHYGLMNINFIFWVIIQYYCILLLKLFQLWPFEALWVGSYKSKYIFLFSFCKWKTIKFQRI